MFRPPTSHFIADAIPKPSNGGWGKPLVPVVDYKPNGWDDIEKKKIFGHQLGKGCEPFKAALIAFQDDTGAALWAAKAWLYDPVVMAEQEIVEKSVNLLDKDQLSAKLLKFADEKNSNGHPIHESKDRLAALKLYAEIQGMMPKNGIDLSKNTFVNNAIEITLVEAEQEQVETKVIEHKEQPELENALQVDLQLVG